MAASRVAACFRRVVLLPSCSTAFPDISASLAACIPLPSISFACPLKQSLLTQLYLSQLKPRQASVKQ